MAHKTKIIAIFQEAQQSRLTHQRCSLSLIKIYNNVPFDDFLKVFMNSVWVTFLFEIHNEYVNNSLRFASLFLAKLIEKQKATQENADDEPTHPLLREVILSTLKYCNDVDYKKRFHATNFISMLLEMIGDDYILDNDICDAIQTTMLENIRDSKSLIRERAVVAMQRLQDPINNECPVIGAYENAFNDLVPSVRAKLVAICAPCNRLVPKIVESIYDESPLVRTQAFRRLAQMKPTWLKIIDRRNIILRGFEEQDNRAKKVFVRDLLPRWLHTYNGNFLEVLKALSLDADEKDLEETDLICNELIKEFLKSHSLPEFMNYLPLEDDRLIPHSKLQYELVLFWNMLFELLNNNEDMTEFAEKIVPDLIIFCRYIEEYVSKKNKVVVMDRLQFLQYQYILLKLFDMCVHYDISDEVGRRALHQLATDILSKETIQRPLIKTLLCILEKFSSSTDAFIDEIIGIIRTFITPTTETTEVSVQDIQEFNYKMAELDVKINIANEEVEDAVAVRDLQLAAKNQEELNKLMAQKELLMANQPQPKQKSTTPDNQSLHKAFDVLNCLLEMKNVKCITANLQSIGEELLGEMKSFTDIEHQRLAFKCCCLYAIIDKNWAIKYLPIIYKPILLHRTMLRQLDQQLLFTSIKALGDLLYSHGKEIFNKAEDEGGSDHTVSKRRLYNPSNEDDMDFDNIEEISIHQLVETITSMLTSEIPEIKENASIFLARIVRLGLYISAGLFTRMFVEWCNPSNLQTCPKLQVVFGEAMYYFSQTYPDSHIVIENSVIPSLYLIGNAPKTSPLSDIRLDSVIDFLCKITLPLHKYSLTNTHKNLAHLLCSTLDKDLEDKCAIIWAKMLTVLEPPTEEKTALEELKGQVEGFLEDVINKNVKVKLRKYHAILTRCLMDINENTTKNPEISELPAIESGNTSLTRDQLNPRKKPRLSENEITDSNEHNKENYVGNNNQENTTSNKKRDASLENIKVDNSIRKSQIDGTTKDSDESNLLIKPLTAESNALLVDSSDKNSSISSKESSEINLSRINKKKRSQRIERNALVENNQDDSPEKDSGASPKYSKKIKLSKKDTSIRTHSIERNGLLENNEVSIKKSRSDGPTMENSLRKPITADNSSDKNSSISSKDSSEINLSKKSKKKRAQRIERNALVESKKDDSPKKSSSSNSEASPKYSKKIKLSKQDKSIRTRSTDRNGLPENSEDECSDTNSPKIKKKIKLSKKDKSIRARSTDRNGLPENSEDDCSDTNSPKIKKKIKLSKKDKSIRTRSTERNGLPENSEDDCSDTNSPKIKKKIKLSNKDKSIRTRSTERNGLPENNEDDCSDTNSPKIKKKIKLSKKDKSIRARSTERNELPENSEDDTNSLSGQSKYSDKDKLSKKDKTNRTSTKNDKNSSSTNLDELKPTKKGKRKQTNTTEANIKNRDVSSDCVTSPKSEVKLSKKENNKRYFVSSASEGEDESAKRRVTRKKMKLKSHEHNEVIVKVKHVNDLPNEPSLKPNGVSNKVNVLEVITIARKRNEAESMQQQKQQSTRQTRLNSTTEKNHKSSPSKTINNTNKKNVHTRTQTINDTLSESSVNNQSRSSKRVADSNTKGNKSNNVRDESQSNDKHSNKTSSSKHTADLNKSTKKIQTQSTDSSDDENKSDNEREESQSNHRFSKRISSSKHSADLNKETKRADKENHSKKINKVRDESPTNNRHIKSTNSSKQTADLNNFTKKTRSADKEIQGNKTNNVHDESQSKRYSKRTSPIKQKTDLNNFIKNVKTRSADKEINRNKTINVHDNLQSKSKNSHLKEKRSRSIGRDSNEKLMVNGNKNEVARNFNENKYKMRTRSEENGQKTKRRKR